jgi:LAO/AO transport system kinase
MDFDNLLTGILNGNRRALAKAITIIESKNEIHIKQAEEIMNSILKYSGNSIRIGITGVPGAGKSTFIEAFGKYLTNNGHKVAVLAVDPSSQISGGSILGDKTRMEELSRDENAFIRPSPSGDSLGGVASKTRESMLLCEAAGYDIIIIETVGVGQSEITVASMVDIFTLLQIPNAGDELQGIKRGVMELADVILINKADGENIKKAELAKSQLKNAVHILKPKSDNWSVWVETCSALKGTGIKEYWDKVCEFKNIMTSTGEFQSKRKKQSVDWMWSIVMEDLKKSFMNNKNVASILEQIQESVYEGKLSPNSASRRLIKAFKKWS